MKRAEVISTIDAVGKLLGKLDGYVLKDADTKEVIAEVDEEVLIGMMIGGICCKKFLTGEVTDTDPERILNTMMLTHVEAMRLRNLIGKIMADHGDIKPQSDDE